MAWAKNALLGRLHNGLTLFERPLVGNVIVGSMVTNFRGLPLSTFQSAAIILCTAT